MNDLSRSYKTYFYSYSSCSTCRRAKSWLEENEIDYILIDILKNPPDKETLRKAISQLEDRKLLLNTSGKSYRALGASFVKGMNDVELIESLSSDGGLIKRPFLISNKGEILVGFKVDQWTKTLLE